MSQEKTLVVILCMHRCGSSLTARLLQRLGMSLGPFDLGETNESNKYGHFEAQPFVLLNREFQLRQFGFEGDLPDDPETFAATAKRRPLDLRGRDCRGGHRPRPRPRRAADGIGHRLRFQGPAHGAGLALLAARFAEHARVAGRSALLVRGPHEIAMSIFRRSQGDRDYAQALDVTAVHFRRMKDIRDRWPGP